MDADLKNKVLAYLRDHSVVTLATHGPEGLWAAAVFYVNDGFNLVFLSEPTTRHSLNIQAQPRIAATIQEDTSEWKDIKGIQLEGTIRRISGAEKAAAVVRYGAKFQVLSVSTLIPGEIARALQHVAWYCLTPDRLFFIDNSIAFGHREEIPIPVAA